MFEFVSKYNVGNFVTCFRRLIQTKNLLQIFDFSNIQPWHFIENDDRYIEKSHAEYCHRVSNIYGLIWSQQNLAKIKSIFVNLPQFLINK